MRALVDLSPLDISRLAEVDKEAAIALVPRLREMLKQLDQQLRDAPTPGLRQRQASVLEALSAIAHHSSALADDLALEYLSRMHDGQPTGPFATLLLPDNPEVNRMVVIDLLGNANSAKGELASVAKAIRDWRTTEIQGSPTSRGQSVAEP